MPECVAVARPDLAFRRTVRVVALAATAVVVVLTVVVAASRGVGLPFGLALLVTVGVLASTFSRADLAEARVTTAGLDLVGHDGMVRSVPGGAIGALGTNGTVLAGRLFTTTLGFLPGTNGRLVVLDRAGRVVCARRAGWMPVEAVRALAAAGGVPFAGSVPLAVPGATLPPPEGLVPPAPGPAGDDPAAAAALARARRSWRTSLRVALALLPVGVGALLLLSTLPDGAPGRALLGWIGGLALVGFVVGVPVVALRSDHVRQARAVLRRAPAWYLVEAVVASGLASDGSARVVGVVDPVTGEPELFTVRGGGERGWLQGDDRTWFWVAPDVRGRRAVLAPPDRSDVALLEQRLLSRLTRNEAGGQIRAERERWEDRQAWEAWHAHQTWAEQQWQAQQAAARGEAPGAL